MVSFRPALNRYTADVGFYVKTFTVTSAYKWQARAKAVVKFNEWLKDEKVDLGEYCKELAEEYPQRIYALLYDEGSQRRGQYRLEDSEEE